MSTDLQEFVAEDLWLLIGIVTFALAGLVSVAGLGSLAAPIAIIGWFLLAPLFLFWGEEIAAWLYEDDEPAREPAPDPLEELKRRYAEGEIDDEEFERRLDRLVRVDELPEDLFVSGSDAPDAEELEKSVETERER